MTYRKKRLYKANSENQFSSLLNARKPPGMPSLLWANSRNALWTFCLGIQHDFQWNESFSGGSVVVGRIDKEKMKFGIKPSVMHTSVILKAIAVGASYFLENSSSTLRMIWYRYTLWLDSSLTLFLEWSCRRNEEILCHCINTVE